MQFQIKPVYSVPELARLFRKKYLAMVNLLNNLNLPIRKIGSRHYVYLNDFKEQTPDLYLSLIETIHQRDDADDEKRDNDTSQWADGSF
jgi:hypothetical protein